MVRLCVATVKNGKQNSFNGFTSAAKLLSFMGHFGIVMTEILGQRALAIKFQSLESDSQFVNFFHWLGNVEK